MTKKQISLLFLAFSLSANLSFAEDAPVVIIQPQKKTINEVISDSSEFHRMNKSYLMTAQLLGQGPGANISRGGATFGKYLDRNSLITIDFTKGNNFKSKGYYSDYELSDLTIGFSYKKFASNSFYYKTGLDYRKMNYHYISRDISTSIIDRENKFQAESIVASFSIGNQWQWENFTLGCDWVGYSMPIYVNISDESSVGTTSFVGYMKDDQDYLVRDGVLTLLRFYLGASF